MESFLDNLKQKTSKLPEYWARLGLNQKVLFGGAVLLIVVIIAALLTADSKSYEVLYSELDSKSAAQVLEKLEEYKVDYELENNGATILVPAASKNVTRLRLAGENIPQSENGFELFQETNFGETQTDKQVKYQMALQGELARTIQGLEKIKAAKVNLVLPEDSLFIKNQETPKASVVVNTKDDVKLTPNEVQSIINLVANSVRNLEKENVVIVDQNGTLLSDELSLENINNIHNSELLRLQQLMKKDFEKEKQNAIQLMLDKTLGKDNAVVLVSAELNFDDKEEKSERYFHDEGGPHVRSEQVEKESSTQTTTNTLGIPGTDTNIPQYAEVNNEGNLSGTSDMSKRTSNYEISKTETTTKYAIGEVNYDYLTVTVLVNNAATKLANIGNNEQEKIEKIRGVVAAACGLRENRPNENVRLEDNISVAFIDFIPDAEPSVAIPTMITMLKDNPFIPIAIIILALLVIYLIWRLRKQAAEREMEIMENAEAEGSIEAIIEDELSLEELYEMNLTPEERENQRIKQEIEKLIESNPENAANVIKTWLMEEQR